jgi:hypothetical protein
VRVVFMGVCLFPLGHEDMNNDIYFSTLLITRDDTWLSLVFEILLAT